MRYAFVSDIHANIQAWNTVYKDIRSNNVDRIICLGDVVGYGPNPAEMIEELRFKADAFVMGNHDAAVCGKLDVSLFNDDARKLIEWTRSKLSAADIRFLETFPLTLVGDGFLCSHGDFTAPANFDYILNADEALASWKATDANLLFVGHTHEPALYVLGASGVPRTVEPQDFSVDPGKRYFINIGSVGQPRGTDTRSCYCLYDSATQSLFWRRLAFDGESYFHAMKGTGLTLDPSYYTPTGYSSTGEPASPNKPGVFTPPTSNDQGAHNVVAVQSLQDLPRRRKKIPLNLISALTVLSLVLMVLVWNRTHPALDFNSAGQRIVSSSAKTILPENRGVVEPEKEIPGWITHVDNRYRQRTGVNLDTFGMPFYYLVSKRETESILLASSWIMVQSNQTWEVDASFQTKNVSTGEVALVIQLIREEQGKKVEVPDFFVRIPAKESSGWTRIRERFTIPGTGTLIQFKVCGKFAGTALIRNLNLVCLKDDHTPEPDQASPENSDVNPQGVDKWKTKVK